MAPETVGRTVHVLGDRGAYMLSAPRPRLSVWTLSVLSVLLLYTALSLLLPHGGFYIGDQGVKLIQIDALARTGSIAFGSADIPLNVFRADFNGDFYSQVGDRYQAIFSPAYAALAAPFYRFFGLWGVVWPSILGSSLAAFATARTAELFGSRRSWLLTIVAALASPFLFYALVVWEHGPSTGLLALSCFFGLRSLARNEAPDRDAVCAGVSAALAAWFRPEAYLFAGAVGLAALRVLGLKRGFRFAVRYSIGFAFAVVPWWLYNFLSVGSVLGLSAAAAAARTGGTADAPLWKWLPTQLELISLYLVPEGFKKWLALLACAGALALLLALLRRRMRPALWIIWLGVPVIGVLDLISLRGFAPVDSIVDVFPFSLAALVPGVLVSRDPRVRFLWVSAGTFLAAALVMTVVDPLNGPGGEWGPRYLLPLFPPLCVLAWLGLNAANHGIERLSVLVLLAFSLAVQGIGVIQLAEKQLGRTVLNSELASLDPHTVATAIWWLPQIATPTFDSIQWYGVATSSDFERLSSQTDTFWWISSAQAEYGSDGKSISSPDQLALESTSVLPPARFERLATRLLSTTGLEADLYRVIRY